MRPSTAELDGRGSSVSQSAPAAAEVEMVRMYLRYRTSLWPAQDARSKRCSARSGRSLGSQAHAKK